VPRQAVERVGSNPQGCCQPTSADSLLLLLLLLLLPQGAQDEAALKAAEDKFKKLQEAYETLSDPAKVGAV